MPGPASHLESSLDRRWRGGHPFRPRLSARRRVGMLLLFILLCVIIGAYWYLTDSDRVRVMAETYLSKVLGGRVEVRRANLSIFEGLRLDDIRVHVDQSSDPDSILFRAKTFKVDYNPRALLTGRIEAARIVAIGPELRLTQDRDTGEWNYQRIVRNARLRHKPTQHAKGLTSFPEILLRDGRVDNGDVDAGQYIPRGTLGFEGRLSPSGDQGRYSFEIQCHGPNDPVGPAVTGWIVPDTGQIRITLNNFAFGRDIRGMLPFQVRQWWESHALAGRIDSTDVYYAPADGPEHPAEWHVDTRFRGVTLRLRPEEWRSSRQNTAMTRVRDATDFFKSLTLNVPNTPPTLLFAFTRSVPVRLEHGQGLLAFDSAGLDIKQLQGTIEGSSLRITGHYSGYSPDAPMQLHIESIAPNHITLPPHPRFIYSLPTGVQEIWRRFQPAGTCRIAFDVIRPTPGAKPQVTGQVEILDGSFACDRFPYPLRNARGSFLITQDPNASSSPTPSQLSGLAAARRAGLPLPPTNPTDTAPSLNLEIKNLSGFGLPNTPNQNTHVTINGLVDHLGPDPGMHLEIKADNVTSTPDVLAAIPPDVQNVLTLFDAPGKGQYPRFSGGFTCWIKRPPGYEKHIEVDVDLDIRNGYGRLKSFPYPLEDFSARAQIRDDYVDITQSHMKRGDLDLSVTGRVRWEDRQHTGEKIGTNLHVAVTNMPVDHDLLDALTPVRRAWLQKVGLGGKLDFDGRIFSDKSEHDIAVDLALLLKDGYLSPPSFLPATEPATQPAPAQDAPPPATPPLLLSNLTGPLHLTNEQLQLQSLTAHRADATLTLDGLISWKDDKPKVALKASATNLALDASLYNLLPPSAHDTWNSIAPVGTIDADATYTGGAGVTQNADPSEGFTLSVRPRNLSITPKFAPYRFDHLGGEIMLADGKVALKNVTATHGKGALSVNGWSSLATPLKIDIALSGKDLYVDSDFLKGVPDSVASLLKSVDYSGPIGFNFPQILYYSSKDNGTLQFRGKILTPSANLNAGVPMTSVNGAVKIAGIYSNNQLGNLAGDIAIDTMKVAGRDADTVKAAFSKPQGDPNLHIKSIQGNLAGGAVAGDATVSVGPGTPHYAVNMVLRNADLQQVAGDQTLNGKFTASLELEGDANNPKSRIGRGDVLASGKEMYKLPVLMGLLQITNLSLPFTSPFNQATAQYILQGNQMTFESIELKGNSIVMNGSGSINFDNKQVRLTFNTDSPSHWIKLPLVQNFWQSAKRELFQITIRGTVQEPKVSANPFHTITTTVDEVLNGARADH